MSQTSRKGRGHGLLLIRSIAAISLTRKLFGTWATQRDHYIIAVATRTMPGLEMPSRPCGPQKKSVLEANPALPLKGLSRYPIGFMANKLVAVFEIPLVIDLNSVMSIEPQPDCVVLRNRVPEAMQRSFGEVVSVPCQGATPADFSPGITTAGGKLQTIEFCESKRTPRSYKA